MFDLLENMETIGTMEVVLLKSKIASMISNMQRSTWWKKTIQVQKN